MQLYSYFRSSAAYRVRIALNLKGCPMSTCRCTCSGWRPAVVGRLPQAQSHGAGAHADRRRCGHRPVAGHHRIPGRNPSADAAAAGRRNRPRAGAGPGAGHRLRHASAEQSARAEVPEAHPGRGRRRQERLVPPLGAPGAAGLRGAIDGLVRHRPLLPRRRAHHRRYLPGAAGGQRASPGVRSVRHAHGRAHRRGLPRAAGSMPPRRASSPTRSKRARISRSAPARRSCRRRAAPAARPSCRPWRVPP